MKKITLLILVLFMILFLSCEKDYKQEIFIDKYTKIYGEWRFDHFDGMFIPGFVEHYNIEFIPFGKFSYKGGKPGNVKIIEQNEMSLLIDFNDLYPRTSNSYIGFIGNDTLTMYPLGADMSGRVFVRISK
jgi:hypothetical protein